MPLAIIMWIIIGPSKTPLSTYCAPLIADYFAIVTRGIVCQTSESPNLIDNFNDT